MSNYPPITPENGANFTSTTHHDTYPAIWSTQSNHANHAVFISGASRGIGLATARGFAAAGCTQLALAAIEGMESVREKVIAAAPAPNRRSMQILILHLDLLDLSSIEAVKEETEKAFGKLDILVNNAGFLEKGFPIAESDPLDYWKTWETNYRGNYLMTRTFLPLILKDEKGLKTIVNLSSLAAHGLRPGGSSYQTTKFAILKFTEFVMTEYADQGVLCWAIHPGGVMTKLAENMPENSHPSLSDKPELAGDTIVFLTQEKRDWLAGRYISSNWDMPELLSKQKDIVEGDKLKVRLVV